MPQHETTTNRFSRTRIINGFYNPHRPIHSLTRIFLTWRLLLLCLVLVSPVVGYDTSTSLLLDSQSSPSPESHAWPIRLVKHLLRKLVRWDAIYMTQIAARGYAYEQEWAFGYGYTKLLGVLALPFNKTGFLGGLSETEGIALVGIVVSHVAHWWSAVLLYDLTKAIIPPIATWKGNVEGFAVLSAVLHILSPAGVFLSAPYAESLFALTTFAGAMWYIRVRKCFAEGNEWMGAVWIFNCGLVLGLSTLMRGNGLFSGLILVYDVAEGLAGLLPALNSSGTFSKKSVGVLMARMFLVGLSGIFMASIAAWPQILAYDEFCSSQEKQTRRPWCFGTIPSIFTWVQADNW